MSWERLSGRNLAALVVPVSAITAALVALFGGLALVVLHDDGLIVDDQLRWFGPEPDLAVLVVVAGVTALVAHVVMTAMVVVMVAGMLLRTPVRAGRALRLVMRRAGGLLVLLVMLAAAWAVTLAVVGFVADIVIRIALGDRSMAVRAFYNASEGWIGYPVAGVAVLVLWSLPLTVPVLLLEGVGPFRAWSRTREIVRNRQGRVFRRLMLTVMVPPVVLNACVSGVTSLFAGTVQSAAEVVAMTIGGALTALVQGAALAWAVLDQTPPKRPASSYLWPTLPLDLVAVAARLPVVGAVPRRGRVLPALTSLALVVPGIVYGVYLDVNPDGLPAIQEQPVLDAYDLLMLREDGVLIYQPRVGREAPLLCADRECNTTHALSDAFSHGWSWMGWKGSAALSDGSWVVPNWESSGTAEEDRELKLGRCEAGRCSLKSESPTVLREAEAGPGVDVAVSGDDVLVATSIRRDRDRGAGTVRLLRCSVIPCDEPLTTAEVALPDASTALPGSDSIAVAIGGRGRPVVAYEDSVTGIVNVLACDDAECRHPVTRQLVGPATFAHGEEADQLGVEAGRWGGVEIVVPPDDRPVVVHRDIRTGAARMLRCDDPGCSTADVVTLTEPSLELKKPELALGQDGLPLIATFDLSRRRAVLIACDVADCSQRTTVDVGGYRDLEMGSGVLDLAVGRDGRPRILWKWKSAVNYRYHTDTYLIACRDVRCGADR